MSQPSNKNKNEDDKTRSADDTIESITSKTPDHRAEAKTMEVLQRERERLNEKKYRNLYRDLLSQHVGIFKQPHGDEDPTHLSAYQEETALLRKAIISERNAYIMGLTVGLAALVSIRYAPRVYIARFGGAEKLRKLKEADEIMRKNNTKWVQTTFSVLIEGSLSFWIGVRAYQLAARTNDSTFEVISQIPLVRGRSVVADNLCADWVRITKRNIPPAFWDNLDHEDAKLQDERTWHAIRTFSQNCIRRKVYERVVAKDQDGDVTLPSRVPEFILSSVSEGQQLTTDQALQLVSDQTSK
jgi:hypothetical protein